MRRLAIPACLVLGCLNRQPDAPELTTSALTIVDRHPALLHRATSFAQPTGRLAIAHATRSDRAVHIADQEGAFLEMTDRDALPRPVQRAGDRRVLAGPAGAIVHVATEDRFEDLHVYERPRDAVLVRYVVALGGGLTALRLAGDRLEAVDAGGRVHLRTEPLRLEDDRGVQRALHATIAPAGSTWSLELSADTRDLAFPIVVDPAWTTAAKSLLIPRLEGALVAVPGGKAMIFGGSSLGSDPQSTAEWFDGTTWTAAPDGPWNDYYPAGSLLSDGRVLFSGMQASAYDPATAKWSTPIVTGLTVAFTAFPVSGGVFLGAGGGVNAKKFVTATSTLVDLGPMPNMWWGWTQLDDGRVVTSSFSQHVSWNGSAWKSASASCGAYGPYDRFASSPLDARRYLLSGGQSPDSIVSRGAAIVDVDAGTCTRVDDLANARAGHVSIRLPSGRVLVAGGADQAGLPVADAEVFDPSTNKWSKAGTMVVPRRQTSAALLSDGRVMFAGGVGTSGVLSSVELYAPLANGAACTGAGECASGFCAEGVCCNAACTGGCTSCTTTGKVGTCSPLTGTPRTAGSCAPYATCSAGACATTCSTDATCESTHYCAGSACTPKKDYGKTCSADRECASAHCVDGFCCTSTCAGQCAACDVPGKEGVCWPVKGKPHGARTACTGAGDVECGNQCDGVDPSKCIVPSAATTCGAPTCTAGIEHHAGLCTGSGTCNDAAKSCGAYACGATACKTTCADRADCAAGFVCKSSACVPADGLGKPCTETTCAAGTFCTDGICCGEASCPVGSKCVAVGSGAGCRKTQGTTCGADAECASLHCVDGVCCDTACADQCAACDVTGSVGTCSIVKGAPHGSRTACDKGTDVCGSLQCGGSDAKSCTVLPSAETECSPAACDGSSAKEAARCDGKGACAPATSTPCGAYTCDPLTTKCRASCATSTECAPGNVCVSGRCERPAGVCSTDNAKVIGSDGSATDCSPYVCVEGHCASACDSSASCAVGFLCDGTSKTCVPLPAPGEGEDSGGCSTTSRRGSGGFLFAVLAVFAALRRRALLVGLGALAGCSADPPKQPEHGAATAPLFRDSKGTTIAARNTTWLARLSSNKLLMLGSSLSDTELYDVSTELWSAGPPMPLSGSKPGFAKVGTKYMVLGGTPGSLDTAFFDPATSTWSTGPKMTEAASEWDALVLASGQVLINHGYTGFALDLYDPGTNAFSSLAFPTRLSGAALGVLPGNKALIAGGYTGSSYVGDAYVFTLSTKAFTATTSLPVARAYGASVVLPDTTVLVTGGIVKLGALITATTATTLLFDPATSTWKPKASMLSPRSHHTQLRLANGRVFVTGGSMGGGSGYYVSSTSSAEIWDPTLDRWFSAGNMGFARRGHAMVQLDDGRVFIAGGGATLTSELFSFRALGESCTVAGECDSLACVDGVCCNAESCAAGSACNLSKTAGKCARKNGQSCALAADCGSGFCVDGFCCDTACSGLCEACDDSASRGTCVPVTGATRGSRAPCPSGSDVCSVTRCNGTDRAACHFAPAGAVACGTSACSGGVETHASTCTASGKCGDTPSTCGVYACGASSCLSSCTSASQCVAGYTCKASTCVPKTGLGTSCASNGDCTDGLFCTDGVCCGSTSCGSGSRCDAPGKAGRCARVDGGSCAIDDECASGHCVDGVCCDSACDGVCEACNLAGVAGKCSPVTGAPVGDRAACPGEGCAARRCDGTDRKSCVGFVGTDQVCRSASCSPGKGIKEARCDGAGKCPDAETVDCKGFACDATACRTSCSTNSDCREGYVCATGTCQAATAICSDDASAVILPSGEHERCYPFRCEAGLCLRRCASTNQCAAGFVCDPAAGQCIAPETTPPAEGGCGYGARPIAAGWAGLLIACAGVVRRRRRP